ncbi:MAG: branched-chain amino acid ABC transporter permease, partial [Gammaproteobacteria bacterium]|nr:branched-chain amino acid ABC transporter permease [Gammaproteobacteria bacterium]
MDFLYSITLGPVRDIAGDLVFFAEVVIGGLMAGVMYSLVALGFVLIFKASGVFNFAQGVLALFAALTLVGVMEFLGNYPEEQLPLVLIVLAIIATAAVMVGVAFLVERLVLRHLVNQEPIILFMSTIGLAFILEGAGDILWGSDVKLMDIGIPDDSFILGGILLNQFDIVATVTAAVLVAVLAVLFQTTRIGRALRAVAD